MVQRGHGAKPQLLLRDVAKNYYQGQQVQAAGNTLLTRNDGGEASCRGQGHNCPSLCPRRGCSRSSRQFVDDRIRCNTA